MLRRALESIGIRAYNPRNKTSAASDSPVSQLLGLISYLIDPISFAPAGKNGRLVMVSASDGNAVHRPYAKTQPPDFGINNFHLKFQKRYAKGDGGEIGAPSPARCEILNLVDRIRDNLVTAASQKAPRLTLAGFVSRLLCHPFFRNTGFSPALFRQALFTQLLEANIAATRLSGQSLDSPLEVSKNKNKFVWPGRFWQLLSVFGALIDSAPLDDLEVEAFEQDAILMLTFHQSKGLEFDHVYVAGTGRKIDLGPALRTRLFSGENIKFVLDADNSPLTKNKHTLDLAEADRDREVYVAMTRAKKSLTILHDRTERSAFMSLHPTIEKLFKPLPAKKNQTFPALSFKEYPFR
jgi:hypothetical protein